MKEEKRPKRVTKKLITEWLNNKLQELETGLHVVDFYHTRLQGHFYEGGAAVYKVKLDSKEVKRIFPLSVNIFYHMKDMQELWGLGYEFKLKTERFGLDSAEIEMYKPFPNPSNR